MKEKRVEEAVEVFEEFNKKSAEKDARVHLWLGLCLADLKDYQKALEALGKALEINPDMAEAYLARAKIYAVRGYWVLATEECKKALEIEPENREARDLLETLKRRGRIP